MATKAELYLHLLQELKKSSNDILSTAIVTNDGLVMSSASSNGIDNETFAAYGAATFRYAGETMEELSKETNDTLLCESKNHRVMIIRSGDDALLVVMTGKNAQMGLVLFEMQKAAQKIKEI
ncbi:MAG: roadblock/LC7 domain-containing protein [Candidatus Methanoperedens sp.]|nr:roadblock/LC7 domain-containing protein [Candidatus Methanoperedens sp.]MCZ7371329.1 roadblock/LC7 domain-containing protein [Candidatus Methanoperedens sp.]